MGECLAEIPPTRVIQWVNPEVQSEVTTGMYFDCYLFLGFVVIAINNGIMGLRVEYEYAYYFSVGKLNIILNFAGK